MLHEEQRVADRAGLAGVNELAHEAEAFGVGDAAELEEVKEHSPGL